MAGSNNAKRLKGEDLEKKIVDAYWKEEGSNEKHYMEYPDYPVTLYLKTSRYKENDTVTVKIVSKEGSTFEGGQKEMIVSGTVNKNKLVVIENFKISYEENS